MNQKRPNVKSALLTITHGNTCSSNKIFENAIEQSKTNEWLTHREAAKYLGLSEGALHNRTSSGLLPYFKLGRLNRFLKSDLDEFLMRNRRGKHVN